MADYNGISCLCRELSDPPVYNREREECRVFQVLLPEMISYVVGEVLGKMMRLEYFPSQQGE